MLITKPISLGEQSSFGQTGSPRGIFVQFDAKQISLNSCERRNKIDLFEGGLRSFAVVSGVVSNSNSQSTLTLSIFQTMEVFPANDRSVSHNTV